MMNHRKNLTSFLSRKQFFIDLRNRVEEETELPSSAELTTKLAKRNSELPIPPGVLPLLPTKNKRQIGEITTLRIRTGLRLNNTPSPVNNMQGVRPPVTPQRRLLHCVASHRVME